LPVGVASARLKRVTLSIVSLVFSLVALAVNVSGLVRRPRIIAAWGVVQSDWQGPVREGLSIIVTARRRPIEADEVGVVVLPGRTWRRRIPEWLNDDEPYRQPLDAGTLPKRLQDGESLRAGIDLDDAIDGIPNGGVLYAYVKASGTVYLKRDSKLGDRLRGSARRLKALSAKGAAGRSSE
jgi:hypothetical protein